MKIDTSCWVSRGITHTGNIRSINQDAILEACEQKLWVVADGMGGHVAGEVASTAIVDGLFELNLAKMMGTACKQIYQCLAQVNQNLMQMASSQGDEKVIGSTVAILLVRGYHCVCLWSGDSRVYRFRGGHLQQITRDHTTENDLIIKGFTHEQAQIMPYAQTLTHALGAEICLYLETQIQEVKLGDIFLLCSDGLNKEVSDSEIASILNAFPIQESLLQLVNLTLDRGARDNISVILAQAPI